MVRCSFLSLLYMVSIFIYYNIKKTVQKDIIFIYINDRSLKKIQEHREFD